MRKKHGGKMMRIYEILKLFGFDPLRFIRSSRGIPFYFRDLRILKKQKGKDTVFRFGKSYPILHERFESSGIMSGHYFHQDLHVARRIFENHPKNHLDIGSRTDGFVAHVAVFREIEMMDIREQSSKVKNIHFRKADLMQLPTDMFEAFESISSLHALEHFGLGRYGDPIDYNGYLKAIQNITRMLKSGGTFYFSVPIGQQRIEFNAHRVFSVSYLLDLFNDDFTLKYFSMVDDKGAFFEHIKMTPVGVEQNFGCRYGCGIFELVKKAN